MMGWWIKRWVCRVVMIIGDCVWCMDMSVKCTAFVRRLEHMFRAKYIRTCRGIIGGDGHSPYQYSVRIPAYSTAPDTFRVAVSSDFISLIYITQAIGSLYSPLPSGLFHPHLCAYFILFRFQPIQYLYNSS